MSAELGLNWRIRAEAAEARVAELEESANSSFEQGYRAGEKDANRRLQQATEALREIAKWEKPAVADRPSINDFIALAKSALAALAGEDRGIRASTGDET